MKNFNFNHSYGDKKMIHDIDPDIIKQVYRLCNRGKFFLQFSDFPSSMKKNEILKSRKRGISV